MTDWCWNHVQPLTTLVVPFMCMDEVTMLVRNCKFHRNRRQAYEDPGGAYML